MHQEKLTRRALAGAVGSAALLSTAAANATVSTGTTGNGAAVNNVQPALVLNYIIALQGIFPSRDGGTSPDGVLLAEVRRFAGNFAPGGWAFCDGQLLAINQNQALFALLGTTYGGNGVTTFALPDLRGRTPIHAGQGPGLTARTLGESSGQETLSLVANMNPVHTHPEPGITGQSGGTTPIDNMMPYLTLSFIVCLSGNFPARSGGNASTFIGEVRMFAGNFAPSGYAFCDGQLMAINQNTALFSILGTTYGGNGTTNFALPDLRGRAPLGFGSGPGLSDQLLGQVSGQETVLLSTQQMPAHTHSLPTGGVTGSAGGGQAHTNLQPALALTVIFAMVGVFPSNGGGSSGDNFLDEIRLFAGNFAPGGWALADGTLLPINQNQAVFSLTGTQYGGNGTTNFALPDLRGRAALHRGQGAGLTLRTIGENVGTETENLTAAQMGLHSHTVLGHAGVPVPRIAGAGLALLLAVAGSALARRNDVG